MPYPFADIAFTPSVRAAQARNGSREQIARLEASDRDFRLGLEEAGFMSAQDHFYMATVSETGWPYVQHRGGPPGFVRVLGERRFAFPDFRGNRQYVSIGNLTADARAAFIFIDYPRKARLKALGRLSLLDRGDAPEVIEAFSALNYRAAVERVIVCDVAALDWNCPQHITPRFSEADLVPLTQRIAALEQENAALKARLGGG